MYRLAASLRRGQDFCKCLGRSERAGGGRGAASPDSAQGRVTEADAIVGFSSMEGTMGLLLFGGMPTDFIAALVYLIIHRRLPSGRLSGHLPDYWVFSYSGRPWGPQGRQQGLPYCWSGLAVGAAVHSPCDTRGGARGSCSSLVQPTTPVGFAQDTPGVHTVAHDCGFSAGGGPHPGRCVGCHGVVGCSASTSRPGVPWIRLGGPGAPRAGCAPGPARLHQLDRFHRVCLGASRLAIPGSSPP